LAELGYHPTLVTGDGAAGLAQHAPFDRIIVTCSVPAIPWPWVEQTAIGGVILTDIKVGLVAGNLVRLTRVATDRAEGMFDAGQAAFMQLRHTPGAAGRIPYQRPAQDTPVTESVTVLDPRTPWSNPVVWFLAALRIGGHYRLGYTGGDPQHGPEAVSLTVPDGSRAEITLTPDADGGYAVRETGPLRLWQQVEHAHQVWCRPAWLAPPGLGGHCRLPNYLCRRLWQHPRSPGSRGDGLGIEVNTDQRGIERIRRNAQLVGCVGAAPRIGPTRYGARRESDPDPTAVRVCPAHGLLGCA